jgi:hypothetical protein
MCETTTYHGFNYQKVFSNLSLSAASADSKLTIGNNVDTNDIRPPGNDCATTMQKPKITKEESLSFLLTCIIIENGREITVNSLTLFNLTNLAEQAADTINTQEGVIPHEVIEAIADDFIAAHE